MSNHNEQLRSLLPEYAMLRLQREAIGPVYQQLEAHLLTCAVCRNELDELLQLLDATYLGTLVSNQALPTPDLTYLPPWPTAQQPRTPVVVAHRTVQTVRQVIIQFTELFTDAMRQPNLAGGFRGEQSGQQSWVDPNGRTSESPPGEYTHQIHCQSPDDLDIAIDLLCTDAPRALYRVKVTVVEPSDPFAQDNHRVTLEYETRFEEALTDSRGCVAFPDVPFSALSQVHLTIYLRSPD